MLFLMVLLGIGVVGGFIFGSQVWLVVLSLLWLGLVVEHSANRVIKEIKKGR